MLEAFMTTSHGFIRTAHPKNGISPTPEAISYVLARGYIGQRKINGRKIQIHLSTEGKIRFYTRQGTPHTLPIPENITESLKQYYQPKNDWNIIEGEFLPKLDVIYLFDFIMHEGITLSHETYKQRHNRLKQNFILPYLKILPIFTTLKQCLDDLKKEDIYNEGLVFKANTPGFSDSTIIRCRKNAS